LTHVVDLFIMRCELKHRTTQMKTNSLPAENAENKVEHEEGPYNDKRHEVDPVETIAKRVVRLHSHTNDANIIKVIEDGLKES